MDNNTPDYAKELKLQIKATKELLSEIYLNLRMLIDKYKDYKDGI